MLIIKRIRSLLIVLLVFAACREDTSRSIVIADFNSDSYDDWVTQGSAFIKGPSGRPDTHRMIGMLGSGMAASINPENEYCTGTLSSPPFKIERNSIHFLIGAHEIHFMPAALNNPDDLAIQLLIDDKVVRSTVPDEFHAMFWRSWDVSEFKDKMAQIRLVDNDERMWAHIDIDHIIQNNIPAGGDIAERRMYVSASKLNVPVKTGGIRYYIEIFNEGKQIRAFDVELATNDIDYWVVTDLSEWLGKDLVLKTRQFDQKNQAILDKITFADDIMESNDLYREPLRSQFHFSSKRGWLNDPNGLVFYDGEYHLFYQHNPFNWDHSRNDYNKTWGHAVSSDLVHWQELPGAIHPDHLGPIYSGSAVVDHYNTTGFQTGTEKPIVCIYTSAGGRSPWSLDKKFTQSLAYSNDRGRSFTIYDGNPVQENIEYINRDPKAIWYEPTKQWVIVLHFDERAMGFFTSKDLKTWELQSECESKIMQDCPEFFQLAVDGDQKNKKWVLYGGNGAYMFGEFDGQIFKPETKETQFNYGNCFYASQTFSNIPESVGRRIQMAWGVIPTEGMPFNMMMLFPVELTLHGTGDGLRMFAYPVKEIKKLHKKEYSWNNTNLIPGVKILSGINSELLDIDADFAVGKAKSFGFDINGIRIAYNTREQNLVCGENEAHLSPVKGAIRLRVLVDRNSIEIFANDGRIYMPVRALKQNADKKLAVFTNGGNTKINLLKVYELKSIWDGL